MRSGISRRQLLSLATAATALGAVRIGSAHHAPPVPAKPTPALALFSPLAQGSSLGPYSVAGIGPVRSGAVTIALLDTNGDRFHLDICRRDDAPFAPTPPARSKYYDVFASNHGTGKTPTQEQHGLAAMAIADILLTNEHHVQVDGMLTQRERLTRFGNNVTSGL